MAKRQVPVLSLKDYSSSDSSKRQRFVDELFAGVKEYGFFNLVDHGVSPELLDVAYKTAQKFFNLPTKTKEKYISPAGDGKRGYTAFGKEHAVNAAVSDLKEFWHVGRDKYSENIWPSEVSEFKPALSNLYGELDRVGLEILRAFTGPLKVNENYFDALAMDGENTLRILHYPPISEGVDPRCVRAAAHEDINLITLLVGATSSGLELKDRDGQWLSIETTPEMITVDTGDIMARITNDVLPSTTHQVVNPKGPNVSRYSMPYFIHPKPDALLECIPSCKGSEAKYPPIQSSDFLAQRLREIGFTKAK